LYDCKMPSIQVEVTGLADTLRELRKYDKELYDEISKTLKIAAEPVARNVGKEFLMNFTKGKGAPLERWHTTGGRVGKARMPAFNSAQAAAGVKPIVGAGRRVVGRETGILRIQQMNAGGQVFDGAGSANSGSQFVKNLDKHRVVKSKGNGFRSRVMYKAVERNLPVVEKAVRDAINSTNAIVQAKIVEGF